MKKAITDNKMWQNLLIYTGQSLGHKGVFLGSVRVNSVLLKGATSSIREKTPLYSMQRVTASPYTVSATVYTSCL